MTQDNRDAIAGTYSSPNDNTPTDDPGSGDDTPDDTPATRGPIVPPVTDTPKEPAS